MNAGEFELNVIRKSSLPKSKSNGSGKTNHPISWFFSFLPIEYEENVGEMRGKLIIIRG